MFHVDKSFLNLWLWTNAAYISELIFSACHRSWGRTASSRSVLLNRWRAKQRDTDWTWASPRG